MRWFNILKKSAVMALCISALPLTQCQKAPINGDLDGQWQVMEVVPAPKDTIINARLYYCFYMHTCMLTFYDGVLTIGNFNYDRQSIVFDFPNAHGQDTAESLKQYGINNNPEQFNVELLNKNSMILKNEDTTITLRKF